MEIEIGPHLFDALTAFDQTLRVLGGAFLGLYMVRTWFKK